MKLNINCKIILDKQFKCSKIEEYLSKVNSKERKMIKLVL